MADDKPKNVTVETYADDMVHAIDNNENGMIKKIIEEQEKHDDLDKKSSPENKMNKIFLIIGIILVLASFAAVTVVFLFKKEIFTVPVTPQFTPIIFTDKTAFKDISGLKKDEIIQTILNELKITDLKSGGIEGVYLAENKKVISLSRFLELLETNLSKTQTEFINDNFLLGISNDENRNLFILMKIRSIADVFTPMRTWEAKMFQDIHKLFGVDLNADTKYLLTKDFEDGIVQNKNARILRDKDGKIVMMYIFAEDDSLIITNSETTAGEVMLRLLSSRVKK